MPVSEEQFVAIYNQHWDWTLRRAKQLDWGQSGDAESVAQESLLSLWKWLQTNDYDSDRYVRVRLKNWAREYTREIKKLRRKVQLNRQPLTEKVMEQQYYEEPETIEQSEVIDIPEYILSPFEQQVWNNVVWQDRTAHQTASDLNRSGGSVWYAHKSAVKKVRDWYLNSRTHCCV